MAKTLSQSQYEKTDAQRQTILQKVLSGKFTDAEGVAALRKIGFGEERAKKLVEQAHVKGIES